jgi:Phage tail lysozyme
MLVPQIALDAVSYLTGPRSIAIGPAVGMVAVAYAGESQLNPGSQGTQGTEHGGALNSSGAYGIWSLNGQLQQSLADFATREKLPVDAVNTQLYWLLNECASNSRYAAVWSAIQKGMDYADFIPLFIKVFEVPANPTTEIQRSIAFADALYAAVSAIPAPAAIPTVDPEIAALEALWQALAPFSPVAQSRMLTYLVTRIGVKLQ